MQGENHPLVIWYKKREGQPGQKWGWQVSWLKGLFFCRIPTCSAGAHLSRVTGVKAPPAMQVSPCASAVCLLPGSLLHWRCLSGFNWLAATLHWCAFCRLFGESAYPPPIPASSIHLWRNPGAHCRPVLINQQLWGWFRMLYHSSSCLPTPTWAWSDASELNKSIWEHPLDIFTGGGYNIPPFSNLSSVTRGAGSLNQLSSSHRRSTPWTGCQPNAAHAQCRCNIYSTRFYSIGKC